MARAGTGPAKLKIEIAERALVKDFDDTKHKMMTLKDAGVRFALDGFGIGYSLLVCLQKLPFDQFKIDKSFVNHVVTDRNDAAITRAIIALARAFGLSVLAQGVETEAQRQFLADEGCTGSHGFLYHAPVTPDMIEAYMVDNRALH